jgi:hypothetical protein
MIWKEVKEGREDMEREITIVLHSVPWNFGFQ